MNSEILRFHQILNSEEVVPAKAYRRNMVIFELVSYVNCLLGCVLSQRRDMVAIWVRRCKYFMEQNPAQSDWGNYYTVVQSYIIEVELEFKITPQDLEL